ncbi:hypothetical protein RIF29_09404 [Crotalaria pallida]|uniref:RRM domain-containing protein n=1 Tax=Crotalaria pallida TaxID=3830 RepID=A0AAN9FUP2_CROPI
MEASVAAAAEDDDNNKRVRIFVGGLGEAVTQEDLRKLFATLGTVDGIETIRTKGRSFAYVDFLPSPTDHKSLSKLFSKYNGCLWKGGKLKLEKAKENYLMRLKKEWEEDAAAEVVSNQDQPSTTDVGCDKGVSLEEMHKRRESLKAKQLHIFFPMLRKVKSIPFGGTGKHKYSFQNIKVPPMPVHFCDCEEHCSPSGTERGKLSFDRVAESDGMNDEEINIMNAVMNKLLEKEKVSNAKHLEKQQDSIESPDALHSNECEIYSGTDEDDLIINIQTNKRKAALSGSQELERILQNQESWLNETRISKEEPSKTMPEMKKRNNSNPSKKRKSLPKLEKESNEGVSTTPGGNRSMKTFPDELGSDAEPTESEDSFEESTKVSWSQKSSWKKLLGDGGNTAFNASLILPKFDSGKEQQRSDSPSALSSRKKKTKNSERDRCTVSRATNTQVTEVLAEALPTDTQVIKEHAESQPTDKNVALNKTCRKTENMERDTNTQVIEEPAEAQPTDTLVIKENADGQPTDKNVAPNKRGKETENMERDGPTNTQVIEELAEAPPTDIQVIKEHAEAQPTDKNLASNKTGRGASWLQKQSWTQMVHENNNSFSISQIVPGITFPEPTPKEPIVYPAKFIASKHNGLAKDAMKEVVSDGFGLGETIPEKSQHFGATDIASPPIVEESIETRPWERSTEETIPKERSTEVVEISETCSFMRNAASLKEWAKAKAALSGSLKRKRSEK